uniref:Uncharacterized protein n=1 Tax=Tanacetum cinerariifolium TaxID=118510 RepID=A0A6L2LUR9_TANCI|nr:hypothetical protein [Tanacetum cinerariifolium]
MAGLLQREQLVSKRDSNHVYLKISTHCGKNLSTFKGERPFYTRKEGKLSFMKMVVLVCRWRFTCLSYFCFKPVPTADLSLVMARLGMMVVVGPSRVNLNRRSIDVYSLLCLICQEDVKTVNHIFSLVKWLSNCGLFWQNGGILTSLFAQVWESSFCGWIHRPSLRRNQVPPCPSVCIPEIKQLAINLGGIWLCHSPVFGWSNLRIREDRPVIRFIVLSMFSLSKRLKADNTVTVVILLHNFKPGNRNDSSSGVNIFRRSQVASISVEALAFGTLV